MKDTELSTLLARVATGDVPRSRRVRYRGSSGRSTSRIALAVVASVLVVVPWTVRNYEVFDTFLARIPDTGALVVCVDDEGAAERARRAAAAGVTVSRSGAQLPTREDLPPSG